MLTRTLLGFGLLSNIATLIGLWIAYIAAPASVHAKIGYVLLVAGAACSVVLYLFIAWLVLRSPRRPSKEGAAAQPVERMRLTKHTID